jgi:cation:H+ antiporter
MATWLQFAACLLVICVAGSRLVRYGDAIANRTGLSRSWIGLVLMATVTSLPELATGVSSVTIASVPDIAVGDVFGSCVFNLLILVILDLLYRKEPVYSRARQGHVLSAGFGTTLIGFAGLNLMLYQQSAVPPLFHVGWYAPVLVLLYVLAMRSLYQYEREVVASFIEEEQTHDAMTLHEAVLGYGVSGVAVVAAGTWLPFVGEALAIQMNWQQSFVGTLLVAAATSTPEVVVTIAALRLDAVDMAIGNILGSNLFNIAILAVDDVLYLPGPLFAGVSGAHVASALSAMTMSGLVIIGLVIRPRTRVLRTVSWVSLILLAVYVLNSLFLYLHRG